MIESMIMRLKMVCILIMNEILISTLCYAIFILMLSYEPKVYLNIIKWIIKIVKVELNHENA